jgi:hypothetical protein
MLVVNSKENLDIKILTIKFKKPLPSFLNLLDNLSTQGKNLGVKRNNYYVFTLDAVYVQPRTQMTKEYRYFMSLAHKASSLFYTYIMFIL